MNMIKEDFLTNSEGEKFRFRINIPDGAKAAILGVHGFAEHIGRYDHIEEFFTARGFSFHIMENRGHGKSVGKRGHIARYDLYVDDLHVFRKLVDADSGGKPLFIIAHSNGSLISARYSLKYGDSVRGLVLSGIPIRPGFKVNPVKLKLGLLLARIVPGLTIPGELNPDDVCRDKKVVEDYVNDPLVFNVNSVGFAREFFWAMQDLLNRAAEFNLPVLFQHGSEDRLCAPAAAREFYEKISSKDKQFIMYDGLYHEIYNEFEKQQILETAAVWIEKRL
jgi:acylglycerol lipase